MSHLRNDLFAQAMGFSKVVPAGYFRKGPATGQVLFAEVQSVLLSLKGL